MTSPESTCWTVIQVAAAGNAVGREEFARRYGPVVRVYLASRWSASPSLGDLDDAVQEVFVECFKHQGVLDRADRQRGFRPFLYGVVRNVALRMESARGRQREQQPPIGIELEAIPGAEVDLALAFDRAWARTVLREAAELQQTAARAAGPAASRRIELLHLRFHDGLPIRDIARRWNVAAAVLHHEFARARQEFKAALARVVAFHLPGTPEEVERECASLLTLLT